MSTEHNRKNGSNTEGRDQRGRFAPGNAGKPVGARHRATKAVETLLAGQAEQLTSKAIELALAGDTTALRLCLERLASPRKDAPIAVELPDVETAQDVVRASTALLRAVADGVITPSEAQAVGTLIGAHSRILELHELEARLRRIEEGNRNA